jgi:hypothetical protein
VKKKPLPTAAAVAVTPVATEPEKPSSPQPVQLGELLIGRVTFIGTNAGESIILDGASSLGRCTILTILFQRGRGYQGPLTDQPAFVPADSPVEVTPAAQKPELPQTPTNGNGPTRERASYSTARLVLGGAPFSPFSFREAEGGVGLVGFVTGPIRSSPSSTRAH